MKLNDKIIYPNNGIFNQMALTNKLTWLNEYAIDLDYEYLYNHSGDKTLTKLGEQVELSKLAEIILHKYSDAWNRIYVAFIETQYKPIENYSMEEVETPNLIDSVTSNKTHTGTVASTMKNNTLATVTGESKTSTDLVSDGNGEQGIFGFNSVDGTSAPANSSTNSTHTIGDLDKNKSVANNSEDRKEDATKNDTVSDSDVESSTLKHEGSRTLKRSGNIGVTTSQQMLQSEIELRKFNLFERMMEDVDKVLCQSLY